MWLAQQLCRRAAPACIRVGQQQRRTMGFFDSMKKDFEKELAKNKEAKELWDSLNKAKPAASESTNTTEEASAPKGAAQEDAPKQGDAGQESKPSVFDQMKQAAQEAMDAAKESEVSKVAKEAAEELRKKAGISEAGSSFSRAAEEISKATKQSKFADAAREAAEELAKQARESRAGQKVKSAQDEYAAQKWKEEMEAKMNPEPVKKTYFKDLNEKEAEEVPEEELDRETTGIVKVKRRSNAWEKQKARIRQMAESNPAMKKIWGVTEKVAEAVGEKAADAGDWTFGENDQSNTIYEIKERDPDFSIQDFLGEVREVIVPEVLGAYLGADMKTIEARCTGQSYQTMFASMQERKAMGMTFDPTIVRISEIELSGARVLEKGPTIVVTFSVQQIHCIRDKTGAIMDGAEDDIRRVFYTWAFQLDDNAYDLNWQLVEMNVMGAMKMI